MTQQTLDIISTSTDPRAVALSNWEAYTFVIDGVTCNSMEGVLQAVKATDLETQAKLCAMTGKQAHSQGQNYNQWKNTQMLYWQNRVYPRESTQYQELLMRAYQALNDQVPAFSANLKATIPLVLTHTIGKSNHYDTVLTKEEFCDILTTIRLNL
jgi:hypothetical protein